MKWFFGAVLAAVFVLSLGGRVRAADDKDAQAILDKAIKALGGEEKLSKIKAATWKYKGKMLSNGNGREYTSTVTVQGLDRFRGTFETEFIGNKIEVVTILAKNEGWLKIGNKIKEMDEKARADQKDSVYHEVVPTTLVQLKGKGFKVSTAGDKQVDGKPAVGVKVTTPEGKDFTLFFDKESGLPALLATKVVVSGGNELIWETKFADYKDFSGIKKATTVISKRNGEPFMESRITRFEVLDKVDPKLFEEPK